jgi:hypothetical protein
MALAGLSTLGITFGYGVETVAGTKPSTFSQLTRINSIGGISITPETIDASALEDAVEKSVAGRASTGATWEVVINYTPDTASEWADVISDYNTGKASGLQTWFEVIVPSMSDGFFVIAEPPQEIPMPELGQNALLTVTMSLTIVDYKGTSAKVAFT